MSVLIGLLNCLVKMGACLFPDITLHGFNVQVHNIGNLLYGCCLDFLKA